MIVATTGSFKRKLLYDRVAFLRRAVPMLLVASVLAALTAPAASAQTSSGAENEPVGAVYVATNAYGGNRIITYLRAADGSLTPTGTAVPTGGRGSGPGLFPPLNDDPLGSQGSLVTDQRRQLVFAANAGSNTVSVLAVRGTQLTYVDQAATDGAYPVSVAFSNDSLFVLNAVGNSISGYRVTGNGHLIHVQECDLPPMPGTPDPITPGDATHSNQPMPTQTPGQIGFSPDGTKLLVVSKEGPLQNGFPLQTMLGSGHIYVYAIDTARGLVNNCGSPTTTQLDLNSSGKGKFPFSFTWINKAQFLLTEVFGTATSFTGGAVSSYTVNRDGSLTAVSSSVGDNQTAPCWIVTSGSHAYAANYFGGYVSSFTIGTKGDLTHMTDTAAVDNPGAFTTLDDMAITRDGRTIYQLVPGLGEVRPFIVNQSNGALTRLPAVSDGLTGGSGAAGIATIDFS